MTTTALGPAGALDSLPALAARHRLVDTALTPDPSDIPTRWQAGFTYHPPICGEPSAFSVQSICDKSVPPLSLDLPRHTCNSVEVMPFLVRGWHRGDTLDRDRAVDRARNNLLAKQSAAAEYILSTEDRECRLPWTDTEVVDSRDAANPVGSEAALVNLVQYLADKGGGRGMLWATPALATVWQMSGALKEEGGRLITVVGGHWVVAGQGLMGWGPGGVPSGSDQLHWAYATDPAYILEGDVRIDGSNIRDSLALDTNDQLVVARQTMAVFWDHCRHGAQCVEVSP